MAGCAELWIYHGSTALYMMCSKLATKALGRSWEKQKVLLMLRKALYLSRKGAGL
jgi:hypothetical protein